MFLFEKAYACHSVMVPIFIQDSMLMMANSSKWADRSNQVEETLIKIQPQVFSLTTVFLFCMIQTLCFQRIHHNTPEKNCCDAALSFVRLLISWKSKAQNCILCDLKRWGLDVLRMIFGHVWVNVPDYMVNSNSRTGHLFWSETDLTINYSSDFQAALE